MLYINLTFLQTQYNDFKEEYSKVQQQQLQEINTLQAKLKEVQGQLKQFQSDRQNSFEHLKVTITIISQPACPKGHSIHRSLYNENIKYSRVTGNIICILQNQYLQLRVDNEKLQKQIKSTYGSEGKYDTEINRLKFENHKLINQLHEIKVRSSHIIGGSFKLYCMPSKAVELFFTMHTFCS